MKALFKRGSLYDPWHRVTVFISALFLITGVFAASAQAAYDVTIVASGASSGGAWVGDTWTPNASGSTVPASEVAAHLAAGPTVIDTAGAGGDLGDINVNDAVSWSANTSLTLQAANVINVNADIAASGASAGLVLSAPGRASIPYGTIVSRTDDGILFPLVIRPGPRPGITLSGASSTLSIDGTPYTLIHDINALQAIKDGDLNGHYALAGNIDATATATWNPDGSGGYLGFEPIAYLRTGGAATWFNGTLQGLGHTITGLYIHRVSNFNSNYRTGLIGSSNYLARVENLGLVGGSITAYSYVGGIIGSMTGGRLWNVYNTGDVRAYAGVGGLVGFAQGYVPTSDNPSIANSYASGNITARTDAGGLVAYAWDLNIQSSYASANVTAILDLALDPNPPAYGYALSQYFGGLVGNLVGGFIHGSYATGAVTGGVTADMGSAGGTSGARIGTWYVGGLVGNMDGRVSVWHSYATGAVTGTNYVGGLFGYVYNSTGLYSIRYTYATGPVTGLPGASYIGGYAGSWNAPNTFLSNSYWDTESTANGVGAGIIPTQVFGRTHAQMLQPANFFDFDLTAPLDASNEAWAYWTQYPGHTAPLLRYMMTPLLVTADNTNVGKTYDGTAWSGSLPNASYQVTGGPSNSEYQDLGYSSDRWARGMSPASATAPAGVNNTATPYGTQKAVGTYGPDLWSPQFGYHIAYNTTSQLTISPKPIDLTGLTVDTKAYNGSAAATLSGSAGLSGVIGGDAVGIVPGYTAAFVDPNAGIGKTVNVSGLALNGTDAGNYTLTVASGTGTGTITQVPLTVTANAASKYYDSLAYSGSNGVVYSGFVGGETSAALGGALAFGGTSQGAVNAGSYVITPSGLTSSNYSISYVNGALTLLPAELTVGGSFTVANKVYDGTAAATFTSNTLTLSGLIGADSVTPNWVASFAAAVGGGPLTPFFRVGNGRGVVLLGTTFSGASSGNYFIDPLNAPFTTANITSAPLTVTANAASKVYNGLAYSGGNGVSYTGLVNGETSATVLGGTLAYGGTSQGAINVGSYAITPSGLTAAYNNYTISYADGALTIGLASTVTPSAGAGGSISPSTAQTVGYNETISFTITPDAGYGIGFVTGCNGSLSGNTYTTGAIAEDCTVTAGFTLIPTGDLTADGVVDVTDALKALRVALGLDAATTADLTRGDVAPLVSGKPQQDGKIDIGDVVVILRKSVGLINW